MTALTRDAKMIVPPALDADIVARFAIVAVLVHPGDRGDLIVPTTENEHIAGRRVRGGLRK